MVTLDRGRAPVLSSPILPSARPLERHLSELAKSHLVFPRHHPRVLKEHASTPWRSPHDETTVWILTYMLLVAAFAYVIGWVSGELVCRCKNAEEKVSELSQQREHSCSGAEQQRQFKELRSVLNDVHKHIVAVSKAVKIPGSHRFGRSTRCGF